jgi:hypothetical protein
MKPRQFALALLFLFFTPSAVVLANAARPDEYKRIAVAPSAADPSVENWDTPSEITYATGTPGKILLWLAGTGGTPAHGPARFFGQALARGYRVISLSYITRPAVAQICRGAILEKNPDCAAQFRQKRLFGTGAFDEISDTPQDAIVPRLTSLLIYLARTDPGGDWSAYWADGKVDWSKIAVAGQSQGGGMAEYLGKTFRVDRVLAFSGGWDFSAPHQIANWYSTPNATPADRWYATYHVREAKAGPLAEIYRALDVPPDHVHALDLPLRSEQPKAGGGRRNPYHGEGIRNPAYAPVWDAMLGSGAT